jgi:putative endonuclease
MSAAIDPRSGELGQAAGHTSRRTGDTMRLGAWGEKKALAYLLEKGYLFIGANVRVGPYELDLVMRDQEMVVFVEVKTRVSSSFGSPEEAVSIRKQEHLQKAAWGFLEQSGYLHSPWRIDVVAIEATEARQLIRLDHYPGAFDVGLM